MDDALLVTSRKGFAKTGPSSWVWGVGGSDLRHRSAAAPLPRICPETNASANVHADKAASLHLDLDSASYCLAAMLPLSFLLETRSQPPP